MKNFLLTLAACAMTLAASAYSIETPLFYEENFVEMSKKGDYPTDGWLTLGNGAKPSGPAATVFNEDGEGPYYLIFDQGTESIVVANTDFEGGVQADEWLISPEIEVPYNVSSLCFKAYSYTAQGGIGSPTASPSHTFKVMVSEGGTDREDFVEILSNSVRNNGTANFEGAEKICSVNGYQGKKIRVAFVVNGKMQGFTGFSNIRWGQYILYVDSDLTPELGVIGKPLSVDYNLKMKAPETCPSLNAELFIDEAKVGENTYKKAFGAATSYVSVIQRVQFKDVFTPENDSPISYKLVLTPEFEGAIPTVIEGGIGFPKVTYPANVVIEEATGTGCAWCPRGIGAMDYYAETYKGSETQGKVINIAVHNSQLGPDPMSTGNERYTVSVMELAGTSLPGCTMNRATRGTDPSNGEKVEAMIAETSHNKASILAVGMPEGIDGYDLQGKKANVEFEVRNGFDSAKRDLSAAIVLIENDVKGRNSDYNQKNALNTYSGGEEVVSHFKSFGAVEGMAPYYQPFTRTGALGQSEISYSRMVFQHVSRGIFPSFAGKALPMVNWEADVPQTFTMDFELPSTILDIKNTEVIVLIINNTDRTIVASDMFPASKYTDLSGVNEVSAESTVKIAKEGNSIKVSAEENSVVELFSLDGTKLAAYTVANGSLDIASPVKGIVLVKVINPSEVKTAKLLF